MYYEGVAEGTEMEGTQTQDARRSFTAKDKMPQIRLDIRVAFLNKKTMSLAKDCRTQNQTVEYLVHLIRERV